MTLTCPSNVEAARGGCRLWIKRTQWVIPPFPNQHAPGEQWEGLIARRCRTQTSPGLYFRRWWYVFIHCAFRCHVRSKLTQTVPRSPGSKVNHGQLHTCSRRGSRCAQNRCDGRRERLQIRCSEAYQGTETELEAVRGQNQGAVIFFTNKSALVALMWRI